MTRLAAVPDPSPVEEACLRLDQAYKALVCVTGLLAKVDNMAGISGEDFGLLLLPHVEEVDAAINVLAVLRN